MTRTDRLDLRPGFTMQLEFPAVVQRPGAERRMREIRLRCDDTTPDTVELNLRGPGSGRWQLDRGQLARQLISAPIAPGRTTDVEQNDTAQPASTTPTISVSGTKVVIARRSRIGVTTVWLPRASVDFFLDCCDQRIDDNPAATAQEPR